MSDAATDVSCPNCHAPMQGQELERHDQGRVRVNLCFPCAGIWFDQTSSALLAPSAVIEMFKEIAAHRDNKPNPVASTLACPHCHDALSLTHDLGKAGRFTYFRCVRGDGRYTAFFQFLREKQFVRTLTSAELQKVRAQVRQIQCSDCGAPIDLETMIECSHCHAPVSFLDADAVQKAMQMWSAADANRRAGPSPQQVADALHQVQAQQSSANSGVFGDSFLLPGGSSGFGGVALDLVSLGIHAIGRLLES